MRRSLGAGSGLAGLVDDPSKVMLTDNNDLVLELLQKNVDVNFSSASRKFPNRKAAMRSSDPRIDDFIGRHGTYDVILGADVVFGRQRLHSYCKRFNGF